MKKALISLAMAVALLALLFSLVACTETPVNNGSSGGGNSDVGGSGGGNNGGGGEHEHDFVDGKCECGESDPDYIPHEHTAGDAVKENETLATCAKEGEYDEVVYCSVCGTELSRETKVTEKLLTHNMVNGVCSVCGLEEAAESEGLKFTSVGDGVCVVSGIGSCEDKDIVIPSISPDGETVIGIGDYAFNGCVQITSIKIPEGVKTIGKGAFYQCTSLERATLPSSITSFGMHSFFRCSALSEFTVPDGVTALENQNFEGCTSLKKIVLGKNLKSIGTNAFYNCSALAEIIIPESVVEIGDYVLYSACVESV